MSRARNLAGFATAIYPVNNITVGILTTNNLNVTGVATFSSLDLAGGVGYADVAGIATNATYAETAGIATVAEGLTGSPDITVGNIVATGNVSVDGTVEYEDVTNVDAVGIITANSGIEVVGVVTAKEGSTVTYYGDGSNLTGVNAAGGIGIQSGGVTVGTGITQINFVGTGNSITLNGDTIEVRIDGGVSAAQTGVIIANPYISNDNSGYAPAQLTGEGSSVANATLQVRRWFKDSVEISGAASATYNATQTGTYRYEERWLGDNDGKVLVPFAETTLSSLAITRPSITSPTDGATSLTPFTLAGAQTIFPTSSIPAVTTGAVTTWGNADWTLAEDSLFTTGTQSVSISISDPSIEQTGPDFSYEAGKTYYLRVRYNSSDPSGQSGSSYSPTISYSTAVATYSISGPSGIEPSVAGTFTVTTTNVKNGDILYWNTTNASGTPVVGTVTINNNTGSFDVTLENSNLLTNTSELQLRLYTDSARTELVYTSAALEYGIQLAYAEFFSPGNTSWTVPASVTKARVVVIGGGGGGGRFTGGGGGGAAMKYFTGLVGGTTYNLTVGAGGARQGSGDVAPGNDGSDSVFTGPTTLTGGGGNGGRSSQQSDGSSGSHADGGVGTGGDVNGTGGKGAPYDYLSYTEFGWSAPGVSPFGDGTNGAAGGGGMGTDNGAAGQGGAGSEYAGGGGGGGADNGDAGNGGDGGDQVINSYALTKSKAFGGGGGSNDGTNENVAGTGGDEDGATGYNGQSTDSPPGRGGDGGGPNASRGDGGLADNQNGGAGGGGAFGGGGGCAGHLAIQNAGGGGGGGLVYIVYGWGAPTAY